VRGGESPNHVRCLRYSTCLQLDLAWQSISHPNKSTAAIAIDMHATFAHWIYSTNRRLPNVRKIKCKYICAEIVPTTARQYAGKQEWIGPITLQPLNGRRVDYETGGQVVLFQHFNRLENS